MTRTRHIRVSVMAALALALTVLVTTAMPRPVHANGVPVRIPLTYLSGLSNAGSPEARGEAEICLAEAMS